MLLGVKNENKWVLLAVFSLSVVQAKQLSIQTHISIQQNKGQN